MIGLLAHRRAVLHVCVLAAVALTPLAAQMVSVDYVEGDVFVGDSGSGGGDLLFIGDTVGAGQYIEVAAGGYAELSSGGQTLRLAREGVFSVAELFTGAASVASRQSAVMSSITNRLRRLTTDDDDQARESTVAGVRASEAAAEPEVEWAGDEDVGELIAEGVELLAEGLYEDAWYVFGDAWDFAFGDDEDIAGFYYGYASWLVGESADARDTFEFIDPAPESEIYGDYLAAYAQVLIDDGEPNAAVDLLAPATRGGDEGVRQLALFLTGLAHLELGDENAAIRALSDAARLTADPGIAETAAALASGL